MIQSLALITNTQLALRGLLRSLAQGQDSQGPLIQQIMGVRAEAEIIENLATAQHERRGHLLVERRIRIHAL